MFFAAALLSHILLFAPSQCYQVLEAAQNGRADDVIALVAEGVNIEFQDQACSLCFDSICTR
jgi:hypothetical protein